MGALEAPQNRHGQDHRTGTSRAEQMTEAMAELGALEAMAVQGAQEAMAELGALADRLQGLGLGPLVPAPTAGTLTTPPPPKKIPGEVRGYQERSGAGHTEQYMTGQERPSGARQTGQDNPQEQEALLG